MRFVLVSLFLTCSACVATRVAFGPATDLPHPPRPPDYVDYFDYWAFGLLGHNDVNLGRVCSEQTPRVVEQVRTFEDGAITFVTLGVYAPLTVRAWCE